MSQAPGWPALFWTAFRQSQNAMVLVDSSRRHVEVNGAYLRLVGYRRAELLGRPIYEIIEGGPVLTEGEWQLMLSRRDAYGHVSMTCADGRVVRVEYAAHPEVVTGHRLVLFVVLHAGARRRPRQDERAEHHVGVLSDREREVVHLVALGNSGPEIAAQLHISHATVRTHVRNAQGKLGARSRAQLVAMALADGDLENTADPAAAVST